jgi:predicted dehydrogenase
VEKLVDHKPRLAFAGVGWIGRSRLQSVAKTSAAEITSIYDPSEECIQEALKIAPSSKKVLSYNDLVNSSEIDGVVIATPSALHKEQAVLAFENDKAVFCQKPIGRNAEEVKTVIDAAAKANKLLGVDFSYRYTTAFQQILPVIQSGELGEIFAVDLKFHNAYGPDKPWFYNLNLSGGGCVLDLGIHLIDLMLLALDFPEVYKVESKLFSNGNPAKGKNIVEDYASALIELENNTSVDVSCSWNLNAGSEAVIEASFYGTNGGVALKNVNGSFLDFVGQRYWKTKTEVLTEPPDEWSGRALSKWVEDISSDSTFKSEAEQYLKSAEIVDRIYDRI